MFTHRYTHTHTHTPTGSAISRLISDSMGTREAGTEKTLLGTRTHTRTHTHGPVTVPAGDLRRPQVARPPVSSRASSQPSECGVNISGEERETIYAVSSLGWMIKCVLGGTLWKRPIEKVVDLGTEPDWQRRRISTLFSFY